jgi:hypothetical protein
MKDIRLIILFLFFYVSCFSQQALIDTSIFNHSTIKQFNDCQQYSVDTIKNIEEKELRKSYQFDKNGNVVKILQTLIWTGINTNGHDTALTILTYGTNNNLLCRKRYLKSYGNDTLVEDYKIDYSYNSKKLLEKTIGFRFAKKEQIYDTLFVIDYTYNAKGLLDTENNRNIKNNKNEARWFLNTGLNKFTYDDSDRIKEIQHTATCCKLMDVSEGNYNVYYTYYGDSSYKETLALNLKNLRYGSYTENVHFKNKTGEITKIIGTEISSEVRLENGNYIVNRESEDATIYNRSYYYIYDTLGRIEKTIYQYSECDQTNGHFSSEQHSQLFIYKDDKLYKLPTDEYMNNE